MQEIHGTTTGSVNAAPGPTFRLITDIDRLPEWNHAIERVVEAATRFEPRNRMGGEDAPQPGHDLAEPLARRGDRQRCAALQISDLERGRQPIGCRLEMGSRAARLHGPGERQLGRISQDAGSQVAGRPDSTVAAAQGSSRVAAGSTGLATAPDSEYILRRRAPHHRVAWPESAGRVALRPSGWGDLDGHCRTRKSWASP